MMRKIVVEKKKQAEEQLGLWQQRLIQAQQAAAQAQEQVARWDAILTTCNDILDPAGADEETPDPAEEA